MSIYFFNNLKEVKNKSKYKCQLCNQKFYSYNFLVNHTEKYHNEEFKNSNTSNIDQFIFDTRYPGKHHLCTICHVKQCVWNEKTLKYSRFCDNPECRKQARLLFQKNMKKIYGTDNLLNDPEHQANMLANRKISGKYKFKDGTEIVYVGKYELDFLNFCENTMGFDSTDIVPIPSHLYLTYYDNIEKRERYYIPDFYMPRFKLAIEIKDGSKFPIDSKLKTIMKERAVINSKKFNYIKIVDKKYDDFIKLIETLQEKQIDEMNSNDFIIIIPKIEGL